MLIEKIVGDLGDKRRWRQYKARVKALPASHRTTVEALERYLTYSGAITKVVGEAPVEFAETFVRNYSDGQWISKERDQSVSAIERGIYKEIERGINKERGRLVKVIERAEEVDGGTRS